MKISPKRRSIVVHIPHPIIINDYFDLLRIHAPFILTPESIARQPTITELMGKHMQNFINDICFRDLGILDLRAKSASNKKKKVVDKEMDCLNR